MKGIPKCNIKLIGKNALIDGRYSIMLHMSKFSTRLHLLSKIAISKDEHPDKYYLSFKGYELEMNTILNTIEIIKSKLKNYKTSYEQDEKAVSSKSISYAEYCAIVYNKEQKKILLCHIEMLEYCYKICKGLLQKTSNSIIQKELSDIMGGWKNKLLLRKCKRYLAFIVR